MEYDPGDLERRWRERWDEEGWYEAEPDGGETEEVSFVTVPYPYPSGGMHIGHARTYTVPDVYARYRRARGDNVLFPIAWHVTGTPIVGAVERLKKGEPQQLRVLRDTYNVPEETLAELETPMGFARHFIEDHYKRGMRRLGLSIDWRREFTTNDERYKRFITWQYETLHDRDRLEKGKHPVKFCTNERNPVTTHDLLEGEEAEFQEYTLIKFRWLDAVVPMATLRPETVRGVTNAFIDPDAEYALANVDGDRWVVSTAALEKLRLQDRTVEVEERFPGERLVGDRVVNPVTDDELLVLPAGFVDAENATGIVMSVPGHSPDDWVALEEAKVDEERMLAHHIDPTEVRAIEPRSIIEVEGYGEFPAGEAIEKHGIESSDDPRLKEVTQEVYNREFHTGRMKEMYGSYAGEDVGTVREALTEEYEAAGDFDAMYELTEEVVCRCGGEVEVAYQDTWFLRYNDPEWKTAARKAVDRLDAIPENTREQYYHTIDWLDAWPCIRNYGLGTRLPWDEDFVIEPLSDSTIYMAYYTIAHRLDEVPVEDLDRAFFDALFYGPDAVDEPDERALELREEWDHWYPVDYRCSGNDLIRNHLTFFLFHHAELFEEEDWPRGITIMGMGLLEGEKMSSSKGHVVLPGEAIDRYGADTVRFFLLNSAEPWQDYDWRAEQVESTRDQLERFWHRAAEIIDLPTDDDAELARIDRWLLSRLQATIREVTAAMDRFETRSASQEAFYRFEESLRWYRRRTDLDRPGAVRTRKRVLETRLRLLGPLVPYLANELHERLTGEPAELAPWPEADPSLEDPQMEVEEAAIRELVEDVADIVEVTGADPDRIDLFVAADWKRRVFETVVDVGSDVGAVMGRVMQDEAMRRRGNEVNDLVTTLVEEVRERSDRELEALRSVDEEELYDRASGFLAREFDATVDCRSETDAGEGHEKAGDAIPFRPAIHLA